MNADDDKKIVTCTIFMSGAYILNVFTNIEYKNININKLNIFNLYKY